MWKETLYQQKILRQSLQNPWKAQLEAPLSNNIGLISLFIMNIMSAWLEGYKLFEVPANCVVDYLFLLSEWLSQL